VTLPTSRRVAVAVLVLLGAAGAAAGTGPLAGAAPPPRPSLVVAERAVVPAPGYWTRARMAAAFRASGVSGLGVITGVTTFRYSGQDRILYSADLGPVAQALYERASSL
jgi:hypothetical protein